MLCFSPFLSDIEVKFFVGYFSIFIVCIHLGVNLFLIFRDSYKLTVRDCKLYYFTRKHDAVRKVRDQHLTDTRVKRNRRRAKIRKITEKRLEAKLA